jgi:hypothetical protein
MMFTVTRNVSIPPKRAEGRRKYPFDELKVGDMFFVPDRPKNTLMQLVSATGRKLGKRFVTRHIYMKLVRDTWEPCEKDDPGASLGIGVYRIE